ncbi:sorting nexin 21 [Rhynchophorus ferrugineus]|uniref:sorting nexin 21 n=1 Tax=Rhynchophorus ferrugineus TaxID=354439 RepID=UPI003FCCF4F2
MTRALSTQQQGLQFKIISAQISQESEPRYVKYTLRVTYISGNDNDDHSPSQIERRYTQFSNLYNALKKDFPSLMSNIEFPKKVLTGNFDDKLILKRSIAFEQLLRHICSESKLRTSKAMGIFLQEQELLTVKEYLNTKDYNSASAILENSFKLINKIFLDRSTAVIFTLCRLVSTIAEIPNHTSRLKWCDLALYRFDGISDSDLLELYIPLIHTCIKIYKEENKDATNLEKLLHNFQVQGLNDIYKKTNLFSALNEAEKRISE